MRYSTGIVALYLAVSCCTFSLASIDYSSIGALYQQNFDDLANSDIFIPWTNNTMPNLEGWHLFRRNSSSMELPAVAVAEYHAGDGSFNDGKFYSFGTGTNTDRALGAIGHPHFDGQISLAPNIGDVAGWIAVSITNNTGFVLDQFTVLYDGEQWLDVGDGAGSPHTMVFEYGIGDTFDTVTWTAPSGSFDWNAPVDGDVLATGIGNTSGRVSDRGGTRMNLAWEIGDTLWLRWIERNDASSDQAMAIDNFRFSATSSAVPEPGAAVLVIAVSSLAAVAAAVRYALTNRARPAVASTTRSRAKR